MKLSKSSLIASITLVAAFFPLMAQASFIGDSATLTYNNFAFNTPVVFSSPSTVGNNVEFSGQGTDVFGQIWNMMGDVFDDGIKLSWTESTRNGNGNISAGNGRFGFDLSFASSVVPLLSLSSYTTTYPTTSSSLDNITSTGPNSVHFGFNGLYSGDTYIFSGEVPEPATLALFGFGLFGFAVSRRKASNNKNA
ncbi:PEP-CTERM sorting domain-containing protein [Glaciimonas sp. Gout2]|uniref:PEP-CTERM sorting domain-containing protein n=1 Tax=unclassified Glaciimonas TaxID=2644401 RepID=UPI002B223D0C|nr:MULTISPECIES: PEP-CTERM sorting domain-containing protein [unclassified Glaciimonas]MEB0012585.1 PEP-CTERM sorting domain-containing protein [Glaciimonas sp. Cout2]MEB0083936.1 PEP-CTERM sorting domain-containing protein [Glaciimonas sp. Gout2]